MCFQHNARPLREVVMFRDEFFISHGTVRDSPVSKTGAASMSSASNIVATRSSDAINAACSQSWECGKFTNKSLLQGVRCF